MTQQEVTSKVFQVVSAKTDIPVKNLELDTSFIQDLSMDSLAVLDLVLAFEENFQMTIPDEEAENVKTIGDAVNYIMEKL